VPIILFFSFLFFFFFFRGLPLRGFAITLIGHTSHGSTHPDELSARRGDLYLSTHNTHNRQAPMPPAGFEPTIPASEQSHTYALDCAATGTGANNYLVHCFSTGLLNAQPI
jgi:hypothetical protein